MIAGTIDMQELVDIVATFYNMEGVPKDSAQESAEAIFKALDTNGDGSLDEEEFCQGCLRDPEFYKIVQCGVDKLKTEQEFVQKCINWYKNKIHNAYWPVKYHDL